MNNVDKSDTSPNTDIELIKPVQLIPSMSEFHGNSEFTTDIAAQLIEYVEEGGNISQFIRQSDHKLSRQQINKWFNSHDTFRLQYDQACIERASYRAETLDSISQAVSDGLMHPSAAKVISSNLQWAASKENPKKYGEASLVKLANSEGGELGIVGMLAQIKE